MDEEKLKNLKKSLDDLEKNFEKHQINQHRAEYEKAQRLINIKKKINGLLGDIKSNEVTLNNKLDRFKIKNVETYDNSYIQVQQKDQTNFIKIVECALKFDKLAESFQTNPSLCLSELESKLNANYENISNCQRQLAIIQEHNELMKNSQQYLQEMNESSVTETTGTFSDCFGNLSF